MELYVHIPFCKKKCRYCSFSSYAGRESFIETYIGLILREAEERLDEAAEPITTAYLGGGTPSLLSPAQLTRLAEGLRRIYRWENLTEFTAEANPGTLTSQWADAAVNAGINRLSIGMQVSQDRLLNLLGRIHSMDDVVSSAASARKSGLSEISFDLMFGIPTQQMQDWLETLDAVLSLDPVHISTYGLIPEKGTPLFDDLRKGTLKLPDPDLERDMYDAAIRILGRYGYDQYEISSFAKNGHACRHNIGYWTQTPYIGLGVAAASMTGFSTDKNGTSYIRRTNPGSLETYRRMIDHGVFTGEIEQILPAESRFETMMLGLRMNRGVSDHDFFRMHGRTVEECYGERLRKLEDRNLIVHQNNSWMLTRRGFDIQNSILVELMD